jgi:hypothetical protein
MVDLIVPNISVHFAFLLKNGHKTTLAPRDV